MLNIEFHTRLFFIIPFLILCTFLSCKKEIVPQEYKPTNKHEAYLFSLDKANLLQTALGREWKNAADRALASPVKIETPFVEDFYFDPSEVNFVGYRLSVKRGQKIDIDISMNSNQPLKTFLDVFRVEDMSTGTFTHVASSEKQVDSK